MSLPESILGYTCKCVIGEVHCDAVIKEKHIYDAETTLHVVETGSENTDHYRAKPPVLEIQAIVSRTPIAVAFPLQTAINSIGNLATNTDPATAAWNEFKKYMREASELFIITGKDYYSRMQILHMDEDRTNNDWMIFNMILSQKKVGYTSEVEASLAAAKDTSTTTLQQMQSDGAQAADEAESATILADLLGL